MGEKLWDGLLGGLPVTPITYMLDGKLYVTLLGRVYPGNRLFSVVLDAEEPMPPVGAVGGVGDLLRRGPWIGEFF
jgi:hypothetical protein